MGIQACELIKFRKLCLHKYTNKDTILCIRLSIVTHTFIKHEHIQLYEYFYLGTLTIIRVLIQSLKLCDMYNYSSTYT